MDSTPGLEERITCDPRVMVGKPVIRGTRIPVELVLEQFAFNLDLDDLFGAYPELTRDDVRACLHYAQHVVGFERQSIRVRG